MLGSHCLIMLWLEGLHYKVLNWSEDSSGFAICQKSYVSMTQFWILRRTCRTLLPVSHVLRHDWHDVCILGDWSTRKVRMYAMITYICMIYHIIRHICDKWILSHAVIQCQSSSMMAHEILGAPVHTVQYIFSKSCLADWRAQTSSLRSGLFCNQGHPGKRVFPGRNGHLLALKKSKI